MNSHLLGKVTYQEIFDNSSSYIDILSVTIIMLSNSQFFNNRCLLVYSYSPRNLWGSLIRLNSFLIL
jgi:hypothetical protein